MVGLAKGPQQVPPDALGELDLKGVDFSKIDAESVMHGRYGE
jgi:hypothetical protein